MAIDEPYDELASEGVNPLSGLWPFLKYSFIAYIVSEMLLALSNGIAYQFFSAAMNGAFESDDAIMQAGALVDLHQGVTGVAMLVALIASVVAYCRFYYRAMKNLHTIEAAGVTTSPFWAVGTFFIPFVNLWMPLGAVRQIWRGSHDPENADVAVPALIGWWWFCWIIASILGNVSFRMTMESGAMGEEITDLGIYMNALIVDLINAPLSIASAWMVIIFSKRIMDAQQKTVVYAYKRTFS